MGQLLKSNLFAFEIKADNDTFDWSDLALAIFFDTPRFYFMDHGLALFRRAPLCDCSAEGPYFDLLREQAEYFPLYDDEDDDEMYDPEDDDYEDLPAIADRDISWLEYDALEEDFDLSEIETPKGLTIIVLSTSVFVAAPPGITEDNEDTILDGFNLQDPEVPKVPIPCQLQLPS